MKRIFLSILLAAPFAGGLAMADDFAIGTKPVAALVAAPVPAFARKAAEPPAWYPPVDYGLIADGVSVNGDWREDTAQSRALQAQSAPVAPSGFQSVDLWTPDYRASFDGISVAKIGADDLKVGIPVQFERIDRFTSSQSRAEEDPLGSAPEASHLIAQLKF